MTFTNRLINESSPYLLQHAHNPVNWFPWGEEALNKAKQEDKPIIVSIGYAACHWCHVMERESFENEHLAGIMNEFFICIKVDREERPDVDQIYMDALHQMGLRGGWPLNVFLTTEAAPFYGGTYFHPKQWESVLTQIANAWANHRDQIEESGKSFNESLNRSEIERYNLFDTSHPYDKETLIHCFQQFEKQFDKINGGLNRVPKFPMPSNYLFLLRIWASTGITAAKDHTLYTLNKMALGGIYDQTGGGFARYSTDGEWFLPHFEKMLYDNAQLLSLYAEAFTISQDPFYKVILEETIGFLNRELKSAEGGFYSALDADSEGEEGKFYVWKEEELKFLLKEDFGLFAQYYNIKEEGNWESGQNILNADQVPESFSITHNLDVKVFNEKLKAWKNILLEKRNERVKPGLDDKILCSWNGLLLTGLTDAYRALRNQELLIMSTQLADFLLTKLKVENRLFHNYKNGKPSIPAFLEDYAFLVQGLINLYEVSLEEKWITTAENLTKTVLEQFLDKEEEYFFFTSSAGEKLVARKKEIFDNVIPSSNSAMAINLFKLGKILDNTFYLELAERMVVKLLPLLSKESGFLPNWGILLSYLVSDFKELVISGPLAKEALAQMENTYYPFKIVCAATSNSDLPLLQGRESKDNKTTIYICQNKTCGIPTEDTEKAIEQLLL